MMTWAWKEIYNAKKISVKRASHMVMKIDGAVGLVQYLETIFG